jgi:hypothetical protein
MGSFGEAHPRDNILPNNNNDNKNMKICLWRFLFAKHEVEMKK